AAAEPPRPPTPAALATAAPDICRPQAPHPPALGIRPPARVRWILVAKAKQTKHVSGNPAKRGTPTSPVQGPVTLGDWIGAARLRTLPLAITPVVIGTGAAILADTSHRFHWVIAL